MTWVGFLGLILSLAAYPFSAASKSRGGPLLFGAILFAHLAATAYYYSWQETANSDAPFYYYDFVGYYGAGFALNTTFVIYFVQFLRDLIGGTFFDYFLLFQASGFWAMIFIWKIFNEIYQDLGLEQPVWTYVLLFLPSLHFFTTPIGKDGPLVLGSAMAVWAAIRIRQRYLAFALAVFIMVLFRPHIGFVAVSCLALALVIDSNIKTSVRISLVALALVGLTIVAGTLRTTFAVDVTSAESVGTFFSAQSEIAQQFTEGSAVLDASYPVRLFSLLFRPFFLDMLDSGGLGLIASIENLMMAILFITFAVNAGNLYRLSRQFFYVRYALFFSFALIVLLSLVYYNVGLGLRQRTMVFPALLCMYVTIRAHVARSRRTLTPRLI